MRTYLFIGISNSNRFYSYLSLMDDNATVREDLQVPDNDLGKQVNKNSDYESILNFSLKNTDCPVSFPIHNHNEKFLNTNMLRIRQDSQATF